MSLPKNIYAVQRNSKSNTVSIVERLVLQTIYVLNNENLQFLGLKFAVYNWKQFQIKSGL